MRVKREWMETRACWARVTSLADAQKPTVIGHRSHALAWSNARGIEGQRVMSDNGPTYVSKAFAKALHIQDQRQGRKAYSDVLPRVGLRDAVPERAGSMQSPASALAINDRNRTYSALDWR